MENKRGFTLIELIITIAVIAIIMLTAVPNIASMNDKNKRSDYIQDAKKLVKLAKNQFSGTTTNHPSSTRCIKYTIKNLDKTELQSPPNGGTYMENYSYVEVKYVKETATVGQYKYYVQLVEEFKINNNTYYRGVILTESDLLDRENAKITRVKQSNNISPFISSTCTLAN